MELINDITVGLTSVLGTDSIEVVKAILTVKLQGYDLIPTKQLPSVDVIDNKEILQRFVIDMTARGRKVSTIKTYVHCVNKFFNDLNITYNQVTGEIITNYIAALRIQPNKNGKKNSPNSVRNTYICLKLFFDWAYKKHKIDNDIMRDVDTVAMPPRKKERLTDDEVEKIREGLINNEEKALFELMISTGLRVSEICNLDIPDINFNDRSVNIREGKTANAERTVYMSIKARNSILAYLNGRQTGKVFLPARRRNNSEIPSKRHIENIAIAIGERAGCHIKTTVHVYRKTFASITYDKSNDILLVSKLLGHGTTNVTERCYVCESKEIIKHKALMIA